MKVAALIVAAGNSTRMGAHVPKPYLPLGTQTILQRSINAFKNHPRVDVVQVVIAPAHKELYEKNIAPEGLLPVAMGADERHLSVRNGLEALKAQQVTHVLIHDAARPFVNAQTIHDVINALEIHDAVIPVMPVVDTTITVTNHKAGAPVDREHLRSVQTPQGFNFEEIYNAHVNNNSAVTDDAQLMPNVHTVTGSSSAFKMTTPADYARAKAMLPQHITTGQGYDVHRMEAGNGLMLCGVKIECDYALVGHSDADVGLHALTDALLGAMCLGDIGHFYPPTDAQWQSADSSLFVTETMQKLRARGGEVQHADITLICEAPKIAPHRDAMQKRLQELLGTQNVNVKATTTEGLGFTGRKEGVAAQAIVTIMCHDDS